MVEAASPQLEIRRLLFNALRDPGAVPALSGGELDLLLRLARRARLLGRLAAELEHRALLTSLPAAAEEQLRSALVMAEARARAISWELRCLARALENAATTRIIALKGCAYLLAALPNAAGRIFADVDLLFDERELGLAEQALVHDGWSSRKLTAYDQHYYRAWTHELPPLAHDEREIEADLHHNIIARTARLKPSAALLVANSLLVGSGPFYRLSDQDIVLHAMTHLMFDSDLADCLRDLVDVDVLLRHFVTGDDSYWQSLWERAKRLDLARPAFYALRYASRLLGTPVPEPVLRRSREGAPTTPVLWLMDHLVPLALFPQHPDSPSVIASLARFCLYVRSLWIRMPPGLLVRHLTYKAYIRFAGKFLHRA